MKRVVLKWMLQLISLLWLKKASAVTASLVKPNCGEKCGNVSIPYPFGIGEGCYINKWLEISCNHSFRPPKPFLKNVNLELLEVSVLQGTVRVNSPLVSECYDSTKVVRGEKARVDISGSPFFYSETYNRFVATGCDNLAFTIQNGEFIGGCMSICSVNTTLPYGCYGISCCQTQIPFRLQTFNVNITSTGVRNLHYGCRSAFLVDKDWFSSLPISNYFFYFLEERYVPAVLEWGIANGTCELNQTTNSTASCGTDAQCSKNGTDYYNCNCKKGYSGNPYLPQGCQDVDECADPMTRRRCQWGCTNTVGSYRCSCPPGYKGDGINCALGIQARSQVKVIGLGISVGVGLLFLLLASLWIYRVVKRKKNIKLKQKFFKQNGGLLLQQQKMSSDEDSVEKIKIFPAKELEKATNNYNENRILGQGGHGTVYKGMLTDGRIVAVKKSKIVDEGQIEQFINEVAILSQINHRNVVKLFGCCLETEVPLLVYEFISNGTLLEHIQDQSEEFPISWNDRLRIATEVAGAIAYLHSAASIPIYHRDIKSTNILLDDKHRAKVADFGTSMSIPTDKTHLTTLVRGTLGYLDPEYFQSSQFTEKSDVYSFGVVLVELLTGQKPISSIRSPEERSLAVYFISSIKENRLFDILDARIITEGGKEELIAVAKLAKRCLNLNGKKRPTMKEVAMDLEGMRMYQRNLPVQQNHQEVKYKITEISGPWDACSTSTGCGSLEISAASPLDSKPLLLNSSC